MSDPIDAAALRAANQKSWNAATRAHNSHKGDQAAFFRNGGSAVFPEELALLGDLRGKDLVHLQCNAGQDTLSLAQRGARVLGVDISDEAIAFAQKLAHDCGIAGRFVQADIYDWLSAAADDPANRFDIAFCSYGALCWLDDLPGWARGVAKILRPGGRLVVMEFHPVSMTFDENFTLKFNYFGRGRPICWQDGVQDYVAFSGDGLNLGGTNPVGESFRNPHPCYEFQWTVADLLNAVLGAGLRLTRFEEYPFSNGYRMFATSRREGEKRFLTPEGQPDLPLMVGMVAVRE